MTADEILSIFNRYLDNLPYNREPKSLYEPIKYVLSLGGKRIRPTLMLLAYNLYKDDPQSILSSACAIETYHNYTLLHDDLMDNAPIRRGRPTVHKKWDANTAILSGDSMLVLAYHYMAQCGSSKLKEIIDLFTETALEIGEGQQYDMDFETRNDVTEAEYIEMIRLKTSVLLACSLKIGAILAESSAKTIFLMSMAMPKCSEKLLEAIFCAIRKPICLSMHTVKPMQVSGLSCSAGLMQKTTCRQKRLPL